jgi:hypothetical protein
MGSGPLTKQAEPSGEIGPGALFFAWRGQRGVTFSCAVSWVEARFHIFRIPATLILLPEILYII